MSSFISFIVKSDKHNYVLFVVTLHMTKRLFLKSQYRYVKGHPKVKVIYLKTCQLMKNDVIMCYDDITVFLELTIQMKKNKGLVRKRKKYEGNARIHHRIKYEKRLKKYKVSKL